MKPYVYSNRGLAVPDLNLGSSVIRQTSQEVLSGYVDGKKASDLEERVAKAHKKLEIVYSFRVRITPLMFNMRQRLTSSLAVIPGEVEIDFLGQGPHVVPIFVDGEIAHFKTQYQQEQDFAKTEAVKTFGRSFGWHEPVRIPFTKLVTQEMADQTVREAYGV